VHAAVDQFAGLFRQMGGLMAERVTDLYDLRDRIVAELTGQSEPGIPTPPSRRSCSPTTSRPPTPPGSTLTR
jgi:phosphoenolpyruvate-protein kinase (PTS system EI component)